MKKNKDINHTWNHRVLVDKYRGELYFQVHEVHYENGVPSDYSMNGVPVHGSTMRELRWNLSKVTEGIEQPVLWKGKKFPQEYNKNKKIKKIPLSDIVHFATDMKSFTTNMRNNYRKKVKK